MIIYTWEVGEARYSWHGGKPARVKYRGKIILLYVYIEK